MDNFERESPKTPKNLVLKKRLEEAVKKSPSKAEARIIKDFIAETHNHPGIGLLEIEEVDPESKCCTNDEHSEPQFEITQKFQIQRVELHENNNIAIPKYEKDGDSPIPNAKIEAQFSGGSTTSLSSRDSNTSSLKNSPTKSTEHKHTFKINGNEQKNNPFRKVPNFQKLFKGSKAEDKHFKRFEEDFFRLMLHDDSEWKNVTLPNTQNKGKMIQTSQTQSNRNPKQSHGFKEEASDATVDSPNQYRSKKSNVANSLRDYFSTLPHKGLKQRKKNEDASFKDDINVSKSKKSMGARLSKSMYFESSQSSQKPSIVERSLNALLRSSTNALDPKLLSQIFDQEKEQNWKNVVLTPQQKKSMEIKRALKLKEIENNKRKKEEEQRKLEQEAKEIQMIEEAEKIENEENEEKVELEVKGAFVVNRASEGLEKDVNGAWGSTRALFNMTQRLSSRFKQRGNKYYVKNGVSNRFSPSAVLNRIQSESQTFSFARVKSKPRRTSSLRESSKRGFDGSIEGRNRSISDNKYSSSGAKARSNSSPKSRFYKQQSFDLGKETIKSHGSVKQRQHSGSPTQKKGLLQHASSWLSFKNRSLKDKKHSFKRSTSGSQLGSPEYEESDSDSLWWKDSSSTLNEDQITFRRREELKAVFHPYPLGGSSLVRSLSRTHLDTKEWIQKKTFFRRSRSWGALMDSLEQSRDAGEKKRRKHSSTHEIYQQRHSEKKSRSYDNILGVNVQVERSKNDLFHDEFPHSSDSGGDDSSPRLFHKKLGSKEEPGIKSLNIADFPLMMKVHEETLSPPGFNLMEKVIAEREKLSSDILHTENIYTSELERTASTSSITSSSTSNSIDLENLSPDQVEKHETENRQGQYQQKRTDGGVDNEINIFDFSDHYQLKYEKVLEINPDSSLLSVPYIAVGKTTGIWNYETRDIYTTDSTAECMRVYSSNGKLKCAIDVPGCPRGLTSFTPRHVLCTSCTEGHIYVIDVVQGNILRKLGHKATLQNPRYITMHPSNQAFVTSDIRCLGNWSIKMFDLRTGSSNLSISPSNERDSRMDWPGFLTFRPASDVLYVSDSERNCLFVYDVRRLSDSVFEIGGKGKEDGRLLNPCGVTFIQDDSLNNSGSIAVADWGNNRISAFDPITGNFQRHVIDEGESVLETPYDLASDESGLLYVTESETNHIKTFQSFLS